MSKYYADDTFMWENKLMSCPEEDYDRVPREERWNDDPLVWRITQQSGPAVSRNRATDKLLEDAKLDREKTLDELAEWAQTNGLYDDYTLDEDFERTCNDALDTNDSVHSPSHYNTGSIECIEAIEEALTPEEMRGYFKGNCLKYLWRERYKNRVEDLEKAYWYLGRLIDNLQE